MEVEAPETITATGGRYALDDNAETPDTLEVVYHYAKGGKGFDLVWSQTDANTHGFEDKGQGIMFQGTDATLVANYNTFTGSSPRRAGRSRAAPTTLPRSLGHHREWLERHQDRGPSARATSTTATGSATVGHLGNIALWTGEKLRWDGETEQITNHPEANRYLTKEYRKPWSLPKV